MDLDIVYFKKTIDFKRKIIMEKQNTKRNSNNIGRKFTLSDEF